MDNHYELLARGLELSARADNSTSDSSSDGKPAIYKVIGIVLAIASGCFIGVSFVLKKVGLLRANEKYNEEAGEGYGYLKNALWWIGMTLMIVGEICNFVAYAFVDAILVTPLGALAVVITTILSAIFLKERLSFVGKVGCFNCIIGSVVIVLNAPEQSSVSDIQEMQHFVIAPGFLSYAGIIIVGSAFIGLWVGPRYGKKSMLVYLSICSLVGGLSVVATEGLGSAILAQIRGEEQFKHWFFYVLFAFVIATLLTEIIYLNKALNLFNAALVTPTYYVFFTSATIVTSAILFQGFKGSVTAIITVVMGFFQICSGVVLLQMSKSAKDVPDAAVFKGDLDQVREIAEQEEPETEPKADAIRGTAAIIRRISQSRQHMEMAEAQRLHEEKEKDRLEPLRENEVVEWDGLRRRKTIVGDGPTTAPIVRRNHPPLGMSRFPDDEEEFGPRHADTDPSHDRDTVNFFENMRNRAQSVIGTVRSPRSQNVGSPMHPVALTEIAVGMRKQGEDTPVQPYGPGSFEEAEEHIYGLPPGLQHKEADSNKSSRSTLAAPQTARRQFSFQNVFRGKTPDPDTAYHGARSPSGRSRANAEKKSRKNATEEERLGLVKGDSQAQLIDHSAHHPLRHTPSDSQSSTSSSIAPHTRAHRHYDGESDSDNDWQITSPPRSEESAYSASSQHSTTGIGTAVSGPTPTTAAASSTATSEVPRLPRTGPLPSSYEYQRRAAQAAQPPPYYSQNSGSTIRSSSASRSRERSLSELEYEKSKARFQSQGKSPGPGGASGSGGDTTFI